MRETRTLRATWRGLETWHGRDGQGRRASPRPYLGARGGEIPPRDSLAALPPGTDAQAPGHHTGSFDAEFLGGASVLVADAAV